MSDLQETLAELVEQHEVPGAVAGVLDGGGVSLAAAGLANRRTGVAMTTDTVFLLGSVTKVWVTSLLMSLVEDGRLDLEAPVRQYLPELRYGMPDPEGRLLVRHLVTHSSGIDGADFAPELGDTEDSVDRYVAALADLRQLHEPGAYFSYCNPGFVVVGQLLQRLTGQPFAEALHKGLVAPLGLARTSLTVEEAVLHRVAIGHFPAGDSVPHRPTERFLLPRCLAPAGATLMTCAQDVLEFARLHLAGGLAADGRRLLSEASVQAMAARWLDLPGPAAGSMGLGWMREERAGVLVLSHTGGSYGGVASLTVVPSAGVAFVAFANSSGSDSFHSALRHAVLHGLLGVPEPPPIRVPDADQPSDPMRFAGVYRRYGMDLTVSVNHEDLLLATSYTSPVLAEYAIGQPPVLRGRPLGSQAIALTGSSEPFAVAVDSDHWGHPRYLFIGGSAGRLYRRIEEP
ncbi:MAG: serine hydrolase domain-containing protein [Mycobacteriales bacterium]